MTVPRLLIASVAVLALSACCCDVPHAKADAGAGGGEVSGTGGGVASSSGGGFQSGQGGGHEGAGGGAVATGGGSASSGGGSASNGGGSVSNGGGSTSSGGGSTSSGGGGGTGAPPPTITSPILPTSGPYGTSLTILGADFGSSGTLQLATASGPLALPSSALDGDAGELWQTDKIIFRYPFPADGPVLVQTGAGSVDAGSFTPSWNPGVPVDQDQDDYTLFPYAVLAAPGTIAGLVRYPDPPLVYGGWGVMIHDGVAPRLFHLAAPSSFVLQIQLVRDGGLEPEGIALVSASQPDGGAAPGALNRMTWSGGMPTLQPIGVDALNALGAGTDSTGFFAWAQATDGGLIRLRPGSPWTVDKTLAPPSGFASGGKTSQVFFVAGTLVAQWTVGRSTGFPLYQYFEHPEFAFANGAMTGWNATEIAANEIEGNVDGVNVSVSPDGKLSFVTTGGFYSTLYFHVENPTYPEVRTASGGFVNTPTLEGGGPYVLAATSTDFAGAACDDGGLRVLRPVPNPQGDGVVPASMGGEVAVWPCPSYAWQVVVDSDGGVMTLVQANKRMYLVKKR